MFSISAFTPQLSIDQQLYQLPALDKGKLVVGDPARDKVSLSATTEPEPALTYQHLAKSTLRAAPADTKATEQSKQEQSKVAEQDQLSRLLQQVLDGKLGLDRKKLDEIEEKIQALTNKEGQLTEAEQAQLEQLQKQKEEVITQAQKRLAAEA